MSSKIADVCDAVVAELNAQEWTPSVTAVRKWRARYSLDELGTLRLAVVAGPVTQQILGRGRDTIRVASDLILLKHCDPAKLTDVDPLVALGEEFLEYFRGRQLDAAGRNIQCVDPRSFINPGQAAVDPGLLADLRTALVAVRLTWQLLQ